MGPVKVLAVKGRHIFVFANGCVRKLPRCNVQFFETEDDANEEKDGKQEEESKENKKEENSVSFEDKTDELMKVNKSIRIARSMTYAERQDMNREQISTFWLKVENT